MEFTESICQIEYNNALQGEISGLNRPKLVYLGLIFSNVFISLYFFLENGNMFRFIILISSKYILDKIITMFKQKSHFMSK